MKKIITILSVGMAAMLSLTACLSTGVTSQGDTNARSHTVKIPEDPVAAAYKIAAYEKAGEYLYTTKAVNYGDAECEVKIYDDKYMKITYPQTGTSFFYYYNFYGDYLENSARKGIFGYAVLIANTAGISHTGVEEIVFRKQFFGGYKFKSKTDQILNDKKYQEGYITWNTYPAAKQPDVWHFLEFFQERDKKLSSKTDEVGNKKDLAGKVYYALTEMPGWKVTWDESAESETTPENSETKTEN